MAVNLKNSDDITVEQISDELKLNFSNAKNTQLQNLENRKQIPVGVVQIYAGSQVPTGWLICDGSAVSRTTYADLFNVIGTTYGEGDESTTFNLPDLRHTVPIGVDSRNTAYDAIGKTGGREKVTLSAAIGAYNSTINTIGYVGDSGPSEFQRARRATYVVTGGNMDTTHTGNHSTVVTERDVNDRDVNIMQPFVVLNYIISY